MTDIRELAREMRAELDLAPDEPFDPWAYAALYGHYVQLLSKLDDDAARYFQEDPTARFSGAVLQGSKGPGSFVIIENDAHCDTRRRNTMSHEVAHIELRHGLEHIDKHGNRRCGGDSKQEHEADLLAGELLLPYETALKFASQGLTDAQIGERMKISEARARQQMNQTGARAARSFSKTQLRSEIKEEEFRMTSLWGQIPDDWQKALLSSDPDVKAVLDQIERDLKDQVFEPESNLIMRAFNEVSFDDVKVVIVGNDPYPGGQAVGLSFSVKRGTHRPNSFANIVRELKDDVPQVEIPDQSGDLMPWCEQGVLLLNRHLTKQIGDKHGIKENCSTSAKGPKWDTFTTTVLKALADRRGKPLVLILWGAEAKSVQNHVQEGDRVRIIASSHPDNRSATTGEVPFIGSKPFSKANRYLRQLNQKEIDWSLA